MAPARKSFPTDSPLNVAAIIMGKLGGIMGPTVEEAAVMAQEKSLSYPSFFMAGIITAPKLAVSEMAVPEIPAKSMEALMLT